MHLVRSFGHLLGGTLLVAGTSIGVGMLALPLATAGGGFIPSLLIYGICWAFMLATGLLILEACTWMPKGANLITLSSRLLGPWGKRACWLLYLFLFSCLMIAHIASGGSVVAECSNNVLPTWAGSIIYVLIFSPLVYFGTAWIDRCNILLMTGLIVTYCCFIVFAAPYVNMHLLTRMDWGKIWYALPVVFTAFGYQVLIPTLFDYMNRDVRKVKIAILLGTAIPLIMYIVWELLILGIIPIEGAGGLLQALHNGESAVTPLGNYLQNTMIFSVSKAFAFFAMTASYLGLSIAFVDFLLDGLKLAKKGSPKILICCVIFLLPLAITLINPHLFISALSIAGGIGVALLLGALPILMVWAGRYYRNFSPTHQQLPGGRIVLIILLLFVVFELLITQ